MSGAGNKKVLQCPYHAWTYGLDGCLKAAPRSDRERDFDKEDYPLLPLRVDTWGPWVFVNADTEAEPLESILGQLPAIIAESGLDPDQLEFRDRREWARDANWKAMLENCLESYHCPTQHPGFSAIIDVDPDTYSLQPHDWFLSQIAGRCGRPRLTGRRRKRSPTALTARWRSLTADFSVLEPLRMIHTDYPLTNSTRPIVHAWRVRVNISATRCQYHFLWPNITISINPGLPNLAIEVWNPDGRGRTRGFSEQFFGADVPEDFAREMVAFDDQVSAEDDALTDSVQLGLQAEIPAQGRFLVESEQLVVRFQRMVLSALS